MFCPKCRSEYKSGIIRCPECNVALVDTLPAESNEDFKYVKYELVLTTYNLADVALIKSILDSSNIEYYFHGENFLHLRPMVEPARLMVKNEHAQEARDLLKNLKLQIWAFNLPNEEKFEKK